jgi:hypothetical protein
MSISRPQRNNQATRTVYGLGRNMVMNRRLISLVTAAAMALVTSTAPAFAQGWNRGGGGWHGGGGGWHHHGGGGIGTGAAVALGLGAFFLGSALASAPYYSNYYSNSYPYNYSYGYGYPYNYGSPGYGYYGYPGYGYAPR